MLLLFHFLGDEKQYDTETFLLYNCALKLREQMKEGEPLQYLKKQIIDTVSSNINDEELESFLRSSIRKLHGYVGYNIKKKLIDKYGDKSWVITMKMLSKPALQKGRDIEEKNDIIYMIENVSWIAGPSAMEVHRTIMKDYERNLPSTKFNPALFSRRLPFLGNRYTQYFTPYPIDGKRMKPIQIYLTKNWYKVNSGDNKDLKQYQGYSLEVKDRRLGSWKGDIKTSMPVLIKALKLEETFYILQEKLEEIYFIRPNNPSSEDRARHAHIMKYMVEVTIGDPNPSSVTLSNRERSILEISRAEREAIQAEKEAKEEEEKSSEGEQPLFGTDGPNVFDDNSIPGEQPEVGEDPGAIPPTPEEMDHNFNNDERPDLEEEAEKESGEIPSETEDREEVPEDAQTESVMKEYSIDELMAIDKDIMSHVVSGNSSDMMYGIGDSDISPSII